MERTIGLSLKKDREIKKDNYFKFCKYSKYF